MFAVASFFGVDVVLKDVLRTTVPTEVKGRANQYAFDLMETIHDLPENLWEKGVGEDAD